MTKRYLLIFALWAFRILATAGNVNASTAQTVALNFYKTSVDNINSHTALTASLVRLATDADGTIDFYIFNINPVHGFVIVSATDNVQPVLAYSTESNFNCNFPDIGIKSWMKNTASGIHRTIQYNLTPSINTTNLWSAYKQGLNPGTAKSKAVSPLLTTTWNQSPFYNAMCPYDNANQGQAVTGCVATAMAQIMKYWNYPAKGTGSFTYVDSMSHGFSENIGTLSANFGATTYQWSSMPASINSDNTAIATLMYHVGVSLAMDYDAYGSMAYLYYYQHPCVYNALKTYFGYDSLTLQSVSLGSDQTGWISTIENELTAGRPVLYSGSGSGGGHAWVCDGFDANDMFHMNWGWGGLDDGYFSVTNLSPGGDDLTEGQSAIIGIQPPTPPVANFTVNTPVSCNGVCQFTDASAGGPTSWLWNFGDGSTSKLQNPLHQYTVNGTYTVSLAISNSYGSNTKNTSNYITVNMPAAAAANNASHCSASPATLSLNTSNPVKWYDSTGTMVSTANPFTTPALKKTVTYWAQEWDIDTTQKTNYSVGAPPSTDGYYYYNYNNNNHFQLTFNISIPINLQSVLIYSGITGNRTIVCTNSSNTTIASKSFAVQKGSNRITLNFNLAAGGPYYLGFTNDSLMEFGQQAAVFPYTDAQGVVQITGNNLKSDSYPYFYDWVVSEPSFCLSQRTPVTATIGPPSASISASGATTFCSGGSVILTATAGANYKWSTGQTTQTITTTTSGNYTVTVTNSGTCSAASSPTIVTVNTSPGAAITTSGSICGDSTEILSANKSDGVTYHWSTGDTSNFIEVKAPGNYVLTESNGHCSAEAEKVITICTDTAGITDTTSTTVPDSLNTTGIDAFLYKTNALNAVIYPNPYTNQFRLKIQSSKSDNINIKIFDLSGKLIEEIPGTSYSDQLTLGNGYTAGVYLVQLQQSETTKQLRVVKID